MTSCSTMRPSGPLRVAQCCAWLIVAQSLASPSRCAAQWLQDWEEGPATYPSDPFVGLYALPAERETGTTAGQFRMIGSVLMDTTSKGIAPGLHGTLELLTYAYLSVRGSLQTTLAAPTGQPAPVFIAKAGPSLHLLPYRRVDLSLFFEGGVAAISATKAGSTAMAVASPGATVDLWLSHWALLRVEGHVDCGSYARDGIATKYVRLGWLFGLGVAL